MVILFYHQLVLHPTLLRFFVRLAPTKHLQQIHSLLPLPLHQLYIHSRLLLLLSLSILPISLIIMIQLQKRMGRLPGNHVSISLLQQIFLHSPVLLVRLKAHRCPTYHPPLHQFVMLPLLSLLLRATLQIIFLNTNTCLLYTSPSPRDQRGSRMPSSA